MVQHLPVDPLDRKLLNLLQADSRITSEELGERLNLSPSAVSRRIQRLRRDGSIAAEVVVLGEKLRARLTSAIVNVQLDRHHPAQSDELRRALRASPNVQLCLDVTGTSDVLLVVCVSDMEHFNAFTDALAQMPLVRRYETYFVKRAIKFTTAIPLEED
jgi:Lrp/AsnC family leucine-responsive transcriptional regulator